MIIFGFNHITSPPRATGPGKKACSGDRPTVLTVSSVDLCKEPVPPLIIAYLSQVAVVLVVLVRCAGFVSSPSAMFHFAHVDYGLQRS